jgi:hypothetical protein
MIEWNIQSRGHVCFVSGHPFSEGEAFHTVLLDQRQGFERLDLTLEAWKSHGPEILGRPNLVSHWSGVYHAPPARPPEAIRKDDAESLLRKLLERRDENYAAACFILAAMLERKRVLKVKAQLREEGHRIFVYEQPSSGDIFTIADPNLQLHQLDQIQHQVADLLAHGLPGDGVPNEEPFNPPSDVVSLAPTAVPAVCDAPIP